MSMNSLLQKLNIDPSHPLGNAPACDWFFTQQAFTKTISTCFSAKLLEIEMYINIYALECFNLFSKSFLWFWCIQNSDHGSDLKCRTMSRDQNSAYHMVTLLLLNESAWSADFMFSYFMEGKLEIVTYVYTTYY